MRIEAELDRLYGVPLADFVSTRNQIAKDLTQDGDEEGSRRVAALKKPSLSAWVVNQLVRSNEVDIRRLIKAGESMGVAQTGARDDYEAARKDQSDGIRLLVGAIKQILPDASTAMVDRVVGSLRAGAATEEGRRQLLVGRLTEDLESPGFGALGPPPPASAPAQVKTAVPNLRKLEALHARLAAARESATARDFEAGELDRQAREATQSAARLVKSAAAARQRAEVARSELRRLEDEIARLVSIVSE